MAAQKIIVVTGANQGIGYETVKALVSSEHAYQILLCGRNLDLAKGAVKELEAAHPESPSSLTPIQLDITDDASIERAFETIQSSLGLIDCLINNAGASFDSELAAGKLSAREMWSKTWDVNVTGTQILTQTLLPLLLRSTDPRLLFLTSGLSSLTTANDPSMFFNKRNVLAPGWPKAGPVFTAYRSSKAALNMLMEEYARMLEVDGVKVWCISPGLLATGLGGNREALRRMGAGDPAVGGQLVRDVVEGGRDGDVGKVVNKDGIQPW